MSVIIEGINLVEFEAMIDRAVEKARRQSDQTLVTRNEACKRLGIGPKRFDSLGLTGVLIGKTVKYRLAELKSLPRTRKKANH